ncbi:hypothetical protein [Streptosporangium vulgare]
MASTAPVISVLSRGEEPRVPLAAETSAPTRTDSSSAPKIVSRM